MIKTNSIRTSIILLLLLLLGTVSYAQNSKKEQLEQRRQEILREMRLISSLSSNEKIKQKSELSAIEDLSYNISVRKNLIKVTNQQANLLTREINTNQNTISSLREELKQLKDDYATMVVKSYKSKSEQSRVMFLMSSTNFQQAYKRLQYIKQYSKYQKQQGVEIREKTLKLQEVNNQLLVQKKDKQKLIVENKIAKKELENEKKRHEALMKSIKKNLSKHSSQIKSKQREVDRIDRQIEKLIRDAMASSNTKAGKSTSSNTFALTPRGKIISENFSLNKGKLPWPVTNGVIKLRYGKQPHPIVKTAIIQSNGIRIVTTNGAKVKAVFEGEVLGVYRAKNTPPYVIIKHGNFLTVYKNLKKVYVKDGDGISTGQEIGEVYTNNVGETILNFGVYKESKTQNPEYWIARR